MVYMQLTVKVHYHVRQAWQTFAMSHIAVLAKLSNSKNSVNEGTYQNEGH